MAPSSHHPESFRFVFATSIGLLLALCVAAFYHFGRSPTDENIFADPPSRLLLTRQLEVHSDVSPMRTTTAQPGDFLVGCLGKKPSSSGELAEILNGLPPEEHVPLDLVRPETGEQISGWVSVLSGDWIRELPSAAIVTDVVPGGASDRAGMRVGDIILRINGKAFSNAHEADRILRSGGVGNAISYLILRDNREQSLQVTLAAFGIRFGVLVMILSGLIFVGIGGFIGLARPAITAARFLGIWLSTLGFAIAFAFIGRGPDQPFTRAVHFVALCALFFSFPLHLHLSYYFPRENPDFLSRPWIRNSLYILAGLCTVVVFLAAGKRVWLIPGSVVILVLYNVIALLRTRRHQPPEYRSLMRPIRIGGILTGILAGGFSILLLVTRGGTSVETFGFVGLALLLVPGSYLYVIARHHLLDLDLRLRRSIQYTVAATAWRIGILALFIWVLVLLSSWKPALPGIRASSASIEVLDSPMTRDREEFFRTLILLTSAVGVAVILWTTGTTGLNVLARKFHRTRYDYRRAAQELSAVLSTTLDMNTLARGTVEKLAELMQLKRVGVIFFRDQKTCCCYEVQGFDGERWGSFCMDRGSDLARAMQQVRGAFRTDYLTDDVKADLQAGEFQYLIPIRSKEKMVGTILVGEKRSEATFENEDLEFLATVAQQASVAIENAFLYEEVAGQERLKHELAIARRIQQESLPQHIPVVPGLDIAGASIPAWEVGGDYYDYLNGSSNTATVIVGDVSGKGTSAALYMSKVQGILRSLHGFGLSPRELFVRTNTLLWNDLEKKSFITALGARFDPSTSTAIVARAGHLPLYHYRKSDGVVIPTIPRGIGIGLSNREIFSGEIEERAVTMAPGDIFVFVSDGITEAVNEAGEEFGEDRLTNAILQQPEASAEEIKNTIVAAARTFAGSTTQHDDQTVVVVKIV